MEWQKYSHYLWMHSAHHKAPDPSTDQSAVLVLPRKTATHQVQSAEKTATHIFHRNTTLGTLRTESSVSDEGSLSVLNQNLSKTWQSHLFQLKKPNNIPPPKKNQTSQQLEKKQTSQQPNDPSSPQQKTKHTHKNNTTKKKKKLASQNQNPKFHSQCFRHQYSYISF